MLVFDQSCWVSQARAGSCKLQTPSRESHKNISMENIDNRVLKREFQNFTQSHSKYNSIISVLNHISIKNWVNLLQLSLILAVTFLTTYIYLPKVYIFSKQGIKDKRINFKAMPLYFIIYLVTMFCKIDKGLKFQKW